MLGINHAHRAWTSMVIAVTVLVLAALPAHAEVYTDPTGSVSVGTSYYDQATGTLVAVSPYGGAYGGYVAVGGTGAVSGGVAVAHTGDAWAGLMAVSVGHDAIGEVAVAPLGSAGGGVLGVSGVGYGSGIVALSGTGNTYGAASVSGTGNSNGPGYLAVSGTGSAEGGNGVGFSVNGDARGNQLGISGKGELTVLGDTVVENLGVTVKPTTPAQAADLTYASSNPNKEVLKTLLQPGVDSNLATMVLGGESRSTQACPDGYCPPAYRTISQPLHEQEQKYTCGPAATRNVLEQMGAGTFDEGNLAYWEHTTSEGTVISAIARELNHFQSWDTFVVTAPGDESDLMGRVTTDIAYNNHSVILGLSTAPLKYYKTHNAHHFATANGYDHRYGGRIQMADEWNPRRFYGSYRNSQGEEIYPYGGHTEDLANVYSAVHGSISHSMVW